MTKCTKYVYGLLLLIACLSVSQANGQTQLEKAMADNKKLSDKVQELTDAYDSLAKQVQVKRNELDSLQKILGSNESIINEVNSGAPQKKLKDLQSQVESLEKDVQKMRDTNLDLNAKKNKLKTSITETESGLVDMDEYQAIKARNEAEQSARQLAEKYEQNKKLLTKRYSQISNDELNEISSTIDDFKEMKGFPEYKKRVTALITNKNLFEKANALLTKPYTEEVEVIHSQLYSLLQIKKDNPSKGVFALSKENIDGNVSQYNEIDTLDIYLSRYATGVTVFKGIINKVNQDDVVKSYRESKDSSIRKQCRDAIENAYQSYSYTSTNGKKYEYDEVVERYFVHIPYLKNAYKQYLDQLKKSPLQTSEIEQDILSIKVK